MIFIILLQGYISLSNYTSTQVSTRYTAVDPISVYPGIQLL